MGVYRNRIIISGIIIILAVVLSYFTDYYLKLDNLTKYIIYAHALFVVIIGVIVIELITAAIRKRTASRNSEAKVLGDLFQVIAYVILLIILLGALGINITGLLVGAGFLGIVLGLAAQNTVGNLLAGLELIISRPFKVGELVTISTWQYGLIPPTYQHDIIIPGFTGTVSKIGLMYTEMLSDVGVPIVIPNNVMNQAVIFNKKRVLSSSKVTAHVEIDVKINMSKFKEVLMDKIKDDKSIINLRIEPVDTNQSSYGLDLVSDALPTNDREVQLKLMDYAISAVNQINDEKAAKDAADAANAANAKVSK